MKFKPGWILFLGLVFLGCKKDKVVNEREKDMHLAGQEIQQFINQLAQERSQAIDDFISSLPLEERIAQLFVVNIVGNDEFIPVEKNIAGGFLYFSYNISDTLQAMIHYNQSILDYCKANNKIPPFLSVDQEGGYVNRLRNLNGPLPSAERVAQNLTTDQASYLYMLQAFQMKTMGFNMNFAPVVEVCTKDNEQFLTQRSFGSLPQVLAYGQACISAYESSGVGTVLKHFPGNTNTDPHTGLPEISWSQEELNMQLEPFRQLVKNQPAGVLMSHARVKGYDEKNPACLSEYWVTQVLRNDFGYKGIIFSDDIFMGALADNGYPPEVAVIAAIQAGIDCIMISEKRIESCVKILEEKAGQDQAFEKRLNQSVRRMIDYKITQGYINVYMNPQGTYEVEINYPQLGSRLDNDKFVQARIKNIELYTENFE